MSSAPVKAIRRDPPRWPPGTIAMLAVMLAVTAASLVQSGSWMSSTVDARLNLGGNVAMSTLSPFGQWRLVAAKLNLASTLALVLFLPFLYLVSSRFERRYGTAAQVVGFVLTSILCSIGTLLFGDYLQLSTGAIGVAFAFASCLAVAHVLKERRAKRGGPRPSWPTVVASLLLGAYLALGAWSGGLDPGSLGVGVVVGLVLGFALVPESEARASRKAHARNVGVAIALAAVGALGYARIPPPPFYAADAQRLRTAVMSFETAYNSLTERTRGLIDAAVDKGESGRDIAAELEEKILPRWETLDESLAAVKVHPKMSNNEYVEPSRRLAQNQAAFLRATLQAWKEDDPARFIEAAGYRRKLEQAAIEVGELSRKVVERKADAEAKARAGK